MGPKVSLRLERYGFYPGGGGRNANVGPECHVIEATRDSAGPGNVTTVKLGSAGVTAIFTAVKLNLHARTNMDVIGKFLSVRFEISAEGGFERVTVTNRR